MEVGTSVLGIREEIFVADAVWRGRGAILFTGIIRVSCMIFSQLSIDNSLSIAGTRDPVVD